MQTSYQKIAKESNRTIVIGDIHGCYEEMLILLKRINFGSKDLLISVGDLVDRGPYSRETASFFRDTENAYSVLGNHERRLAGVIRGKSRAAWSQLHTLSKIAKVEYESWAGYFEEFPAVIETYHAIITHARLDPSKKITEQEPYYTCAVGGKAIKIETDNTGVPLWFHEWKANNSPGKPICMGHIGYKQIELEQKALFALDTGAVRGGQLTAAIFPEQQIVSIDCPDYYSIAKEEWKSQKFNPKTDRSELLSIYKIVSILNKEQPYEDEKQLLSRFNQSLANYDFEKKTRLLHENLVSKFGILPPAGPQRGDYFKMIRSCLGSGLNTRLITLILSDKPLQWEIMAKVFQNKSLQDIASACSNIEDCIENPAINRLSE